MKNFFKMVFASLLGTVLASMVLFFFAFAIIAGIASVASSDKEVSIKKHTILALDLDEKIVEHKNSNPFDMTSFSKADFKQLALNDIIKNIKKAKKDDNIDGIFLHLSSISAGLASVEEIRNALLDFKESGKFIISHANYYTHKSYFVASVADQIYLTPEGSMQFVGLSAQIMFYKNLFKKIDVEPVIIRHGKFKSAVEPFMLDKMSEANREQTSTFIGNMWNDMIVKIAESRKLSVDKLNQIANDLLIKDSKSCVELGLVDSLKYYDELLAVLQEKTEAKKIKDLEFTSIPEYDNAVVKNDEEDKASRKDRIAVIYAAGEIVDGEGKADNIGGASLSRTIRKVRQDKKIKAIVLRVNSPGGSALASEIILREVKLAKEEKPLIVSMGNYAASGGYYISCAADTIVSDANTITGSIGVFGMLFNVSKLLNNRLGINVDVVNTNKYSDIGSMARTMKPEEIAYIQNSVEDVYSTFIKHVAEGRGMTTAEVDSIGQGRVWSGIKAKELGLVDVIGGLDSAISIAAKKAELENYRLVTYPKKKEPFEAIMETLNDMQVSSIEKELGSMSEYYKMFKNMAERKGIQARVPMEIAIE